MSPLKITFWPFWTFLTPLLRSSLTAIGYIRYHDFLGVQKTLNFFQNLEKSVSRLMLTLKINFHVNLTMFSWCHAVVGCWRLKKNTTRAPNICYIWFLSSFFILFLKIICFEPLLWYLAGTVSTQLVGHYQIILISNVLHFILGLFSF